MMMSGIMIIVETAVITGVTAMNNIKTTNLI